MQRLLSFSMSLIVLVGTGLASSAHAATTMTQPLATTYGAQATDVDRIVMAIRANPADLTLRRMLVQALIKKGLTVKAAEQMRVVLSVAGNNADDLTTLGDAYRYSGNSGNAIQSYKAALTLQPLFVKARTGLALTYARSGDLNTAVELCQNGLAQISDPASRRELAATLNSVREQSLSVASAAVAALPQ